MSVAALSPQLKKAVLAYLGVAPGLPSLENLQQLLQLYPERVPWESAFRIKKRSQTKSTANCPRWPAEFWADALERGGGGTCFESNYALLALLRSAGYEGYLTINDMGETVGCHTAIIILVDGENWLVDVGLPLYAPLPLASRGAQQVQARFHTYTVRPDGPNRYQIERDRHPKPNCFTLIDRPVPEQLYREALTSDYGDEGLFLDKVVITKVVGGVPWRFNSTELPWHLESFADGGRQDHVLSGDIAAAVARHFSMDEETVRVALRAVGQGENRA